MFDTIKRMRGEKGFTLIELLIVILILGLLLAIALPTFLNQQDKAKDSDAKTKLNTAYKIVKSEQAGNSDGALPTPDEAVSAMNASEGSGFAVTAGATTGQVEVDSSSGSLVLSVTSDSGKSFYATVNSNGSVQFSF